MQSSAPETPDLPLGPGVRILQSHPLGLIALEKPCTVLSHPNEPSDQPRSLLNAPYSADEESYDLGEGRFAHLIHRLDSATSGVLLIALDPQLARLAREAFAQRTVEKVYHALVFGVPRHRRDEWDDRYTTERRQNKVRGISQGPDTATCHVRSTATHSGQPVITHLELRPLTGRSHQLRVQCQKRKLPIVGDAVYGDFSKNRLFTKQTGHDRLFLHAESIALSLPWKGRTLTVAAHSPLPDIFHQPRK